MNIKKLMGIISATLLAVGLSACGSKIFSISLPETIAIEKGTSERLDIVYSAENGILDNILKKEIEQLHLQWSSTNQDVAKVNQQGDITAIQSGKTQINVKSEDGRLSAVCDVSVIITPESVSAPKNMQMIVGDIQNIDISISPKDASIERIMFESSDKSVATVDEKGQLTAVDIGECIIKITPMSMAEEVYTKVVVTR